MILETGSTQHYIFDSNKRRLNVGASYLVAQLPNWVARAIERQPIGAVDAVVNSSGACRLLVSSREVGIDVVRRVTEAALTDAPGLAVWGYVDPEPIEGRDARQALREALRGHDRLRHSTVPSASRFPMLPFTRSCRYTGQPVAAQINMTDTGEDGTRQERTEWVSEVARAKWGAGSAGLKAIRESLDGSPAVVTEQELDDHIGDQWTAVVHADGNGLGQIVAGLEVEELKEFSAALAQVSTSALVSAIETTQQWIEEREFALSAWILPLVLGGDDLTAVVDARVARAFAVNYLRAFEKETAQANLVGERKGLTACAGIAIVKPSHPFSSAYARAEELAASAKAVKFLGTPHGLSAYDIHVFHESSSRSLASVRADLTHHRGDVESRLWPGPLVVGEESDADAETGGYASAADLDRAVTKIGDRTLISSAAAHRLRAAMTAGPTQTEKAVGVLISQMRAGVHGGGPRQAREFTELWEAANSVKTPDGATASHALTAMDLADVEGVAWASSST